MAKIIKTAWPNVKGVHPGTTALSAPAPHENTGNVQDDGADAARLFYTLGPQTAVRKLPLVVRGGNPEVFFFFKRLKKRFKKYKYK